jgi:hypothetical protein
MLAAMVPHFDRLYSVELSEMLHRRAIERFRMEPSVRLRQGDSGQVVREILQDLHQPALFWLDAHYSGGLTARGSVDSPIIAELEAVLDHGPAHVVLVDDARMFDGTGGYPTLESLRALVAARRPDYQLAVAQDVIRLTPGDR